ncbi:hypothetical protein DMC47_41335 [Nostoc sp. 3335mG]|nr:hypothetical protein DMC47_41335 [Nostoc sp. 3335mG]
MALPSRGGDQMSSMLSPIASVARGDWTRKLPISPLKGEVPGRAERGASRQHQRSGYCPINLR